MSKLLFNISLLTFLLLSQIGFCETITRVSVANDGSEASGMSRGLGISNDGRFILFVSDAPYIVDGDITSGTSGEDIFIRDEVNKTTEMVSVSSDGEHGVDAYGRSCRSSSATMSGDGRYVFFKSQCANFDNSCTTYNHHLFIRDRLAGTTECIINDFKYYSDYHINENGQFMVYGESISHLFNPKELFVRDIINGTVRKISVSSNGTDGNERHAAFSISSDGRYVPFHSDSTNLVINDTNNVDDVFLRDLQEGTTKRISVNSNDEQGNGMSRYPAISDKGRYISFASDADNLVPDDTNGVYDVFVYDLQNETITRISVSSNGFEGNGASSGAAFFSANERFITFSSEATNLVLNDTNGERDVFVHDLLTRTTTRISVNGDGAEGNYSSFTTLRPFNSDNTKILFNSYSTNFVLNDNNDERDAFVRHNFVPFQLSPVGYFGYITQTPKFGPPGTMFTQSGTEFTPDSTVTLHFLDKDGNLLPTQQLATDVTGFFTTDYTAPGDKPIGTYTWWAADDTTGKISARIGYAITDSSGTGTEIGDGETEDPPQKVTNAFGTLVRIGDWDPSKETFIIVHGWNPNGDWYIPSWVTAMGFAIRNNDDSPAKEANVFFWNWMEKAESKWPDFLNNEDCADWLHVPFDMTESSGWWLAAALYDALPHTYDKNIHFIGHSLGTLVSTYATKVAQEFYSFRSFSGHINHLVFLDSPCDFGKPGGNFLVDNEDDIFLENYLSGYLTGQSGGYAISDIDVNLHAKSDQVPDVSRHSYAYEWYRSSITGFKDSTILEDNTVPSTYPHYGFYWWNKDNRPNGFRQYAQKESEPHWKLFLEDFEAKPAGKVNDAAQYSGKISSKTWDGLTKYAQATGKQVDILSVNTFNSASDVAAAVKNAAGHAMQQNIVCPAGVENPCGTLHLSHASKTVVSMPITIPVGANTMTFGYEWIYADANSLLEVVINDKPICHFVSDQEIGQGYDMTPWMNISTYAGQQITLTLRLSNATPGTEGAITLDDLIFAQISDEVASFPWTMFLPAIIGDRQ